MRSATPKRMMTKRRAFLALIALAASFGLPAAARADPLWIVPEPWRPAAPGPVPVQALVGATPLAVEALTAVTVRDSIGERRLGASIRAAGTVSWPIALRAAGTTLIALSSRPEIDHMEPAPFDAYLNRTGFTAVAAARRRVGCGGRPVAVTVFHHAKSLIQIGPTTTRAAFDRVRHPLEIVLLDDPFRPPDRSGLVDVRFRVLLRGAPLPGAPTYVVPLFGANQFGPAGHGPADAGGQSHFAFFATGGALIQALHLEPRGRENCTDYVLHVATIAMRP